MSRSSGIRILAVLAACLAALAVPALAAGIHFQKESVHAYEGQLSHREVHADAFHPGSATGHLHVSLNDGRHMSVAYPTSQQARLIAQARSAGTRVKVATVKPKRAAAVKHKLRYIAGGILVAVIVIVLIVLLIGRRRSLAEQGGTGRASEENASS